jgi:hypothetical protein
MPTSGRKAPVPALARLHPLAASEEAFENWVVRAAEFYGWHGVHIRSSKDVLRGVFREDAYGEPDWRFWRDEPPRMMWRELKTDFGHLSVFQRERIALFRRCGLDADVWRPSDETRIRHEFDS